MDKKYPTMTSALHLKLTLFLVIGLTTYHVSNAFTVITTGSGSSSSSRRTTRQSARRQGDVFGVVATSGEGQRNQQSALFMADGNKDDDIRVKSVLKKELAYDESTGRFFEADEKECIAEDEFCMLDKDSGKYIRLTVEEKERIFLDSLQVRIWA